MKPLPRFSGPAIFILAMSVLVLEVTMTRIFSVMTYHHFTYMIISLTLLGFGAAGTVLTVDKRFSGDTVDPVLLADCAWLYGLATMVCFITITKINFDAMSIYMYNDYSQLYSLLLILVLTATPFFFGGLCIGYLVSKSHEQINKLYFFDLLGAGTGSLISILGINYLGAPGTIFLMSMVAGLVAVMLGNSGGLIRKRYRVTALIAAALAIASIINDDVIPVPFPPSKRFNQYQTEHRWHVVARVDVGKPASTYSSFGGKLSRVYERPMPPLIFRYILQDGIAPTGIIKLDGRDPTRMDIFGYYLQGCAYVIRSGGDVLVIGPGGGVDVAIALHGGARHVTAVDINPWIIDYVKNKYNKFAGGLYRRSDVTVVCSEGRHYLTRDGKKYEVIQLSGVDTFSALASGAYALAENYLYTMEAVSLFLDHLSPNGVLSFSRWLFTPPRETLRLAVTAREVLEKRGVANPERNIMVIAGHRNDDPWAETLIKLQPFTSEEVAKMKEWAGRMKFDVIYNPLLAYEPGGPYDALAKTRVFNPTLCAREFNTAIRAKGEDFEEFKQAYFYDITPTPDDAPFFFNFYKLRSLLHPFEKTFGGYPITRFPLGLFILVVSFILIVILGAVFILLPFRGRFKKLAGRVGVVHVFVYFAAIGIAFMAIEITILQKLMVFLGGPVYSMAVTLFSLLVFCGVGSFLAKRLTSDNLARRGVTIIIVLDVLVLALIWALNHVIPELMGYGRAARCIIAVLMLMPVGLLMGMPFPTGIRMAERCDPELVPWGWCVNAIATVLSSIAAILLAMFVGLSAVAYGALAVYLIALLAMLRAPAGAEASRSR